MQCLYAVSIGNSNLEELVDFVAGEREESPSDETRDYCTQLTGFALEKREWADRLITSKLEHWDLGRITLIDKLILELALVEMVSFDNVPLKVSISEAIEIAKKYSTDDSPGFINGILDAAYHDIIKKESVS